MNTQKLGATEMSYRRTLGGFVLAASVAALAAGSRPAQAADLGGNCCADLEERIAELEATTVRKGNRKVSLAVTGFVAQQLLVWDDGVESNAYVTDTGSVSIGSHFKFTGQATIAPGWSAGYVINIEVINNDSLLVNQNSDDPSGNALGLVASGSSSPIAIESSYWFIKSDRLGRISVGQQSSAADNAAILPDGSGSLVQANYVLYDVNGFFLRQTNGQLLNFNFGDLANCYPLAGGGGVAGDCDGYPSNLIRYDSPTLAGFSFSASWGEDDAWAVSGRYAGEFNGLKLAAAIAYNQNTDERGPGGLSRPAGFDGAGLQLGAYLQHVPTGLFVYGAYSREFVDSRTGIAAYDNKPEGDQWYVKTGLRRRWTPLGHTVLYGEYGENDDRLSVALFQAGATGSNLEQYGVGLVQEIDAAAMQLWVAWRHYEPEVDGLVNGAPVQLEDFDLFKVGALINF